MSDYRLTATAVVIRTADGAQIPNDPMNGDRMAYNAWLADGNLPDPNEAPAPQPQTILPQDLMAQFSEDDAAKIQTAISGNVKIWLLWQAMTAQKDPMEVSNARFLAGYAALVQVLGQDRMNKIAGALGVSALVG